MGFWASSLASGISTDVHVHKRYSRSNNVVREILERPLLNMGTAFSEEAPSCELSK
jgi:hypothetical protein